ncbi:hypothetical protein BDK51DRAFT_47281, partial [Blyttiomyces helicus]
MPRPAAAAFAACKRLQTSSFSPRHNHNNCPRFSSTAAADQTPPPPPPQQEAALLPENADSAPAAPAPPTFSLGIASAPLMWPGRVDLSAFPDSKLPNLPTPTYDPKVGWPAPHVPVDPTAPLPLPTDRSLGPLVHYVHLLRKLRGKAPRGPGSDKLPLSEIDELVRASPSVFALSPADVILAFERIGAIPGAETLDRVHALLEHLGAAPASEGDAVRRTTEILLAALEARGVKPNAATLSHMIVANAHDPARALALLDRVRATSAGRPTPRAFAILARIFSEAKVSKSALWELWGMYWEWSSPRGRAAVTGKKGGKAKQPEARRPERDDMILLEAFLTAFAKTGDLYAVGKLLNRMSEVGEAFTPSTFAVILDAMAECASEKGFEQAVERMNAANIIYNRLMREFAHPRIQLAIVVQQIIPKDLPPNTPTQPSAILNAMLKFHVLNFKPLSAIRTHTHFTQLQIEPDHTTHMLILQACAAKRSSDTFILADEKGLEVGIETVRGRVRPQIEAQMRAGPESSGAVVGLHTWIALLVGIPKVRGAAPADVWECYGLLRDEFYPLWTESASTKKKPFVPSMEVIDALAWATGVSARQDALVQFADAVMQPATVRALYRLDGGDAKPLKRDDEPLRQVYEKMLTLWLDGGGDGAVVVHALADVREREKRVLGGMLEEEEARVKEVVAKARPGEIWKVMGDVDVGKGEVWKVVGDVKAGKVEEGKAKAKAGKGNGKAKANAKGVEGKAKIDPLEFADVSDPLCLRISLPPPPPPSPTTRTLNMMPGVMNPGGMQEEITTIFVVGFPDDMQEREFQNMFTFSSGFEAATLKIPSDGGLGGGLSGVPEEGGLGGGIMTGSFGSMGNGMGNGIGNGRKQIIGFAKFRTRLEALEARDVLSGRKVDAERGCVLKAEMAKKNLHTKRGLSNDPNHAFSLNQLAHLSRRGSKDIFPDPFYIGSPTLGFSLPRDLSTPNDFPSALDLCNIYGSSAEHDHPIITRSSPIGFSDSPYSHSERAAASSYGEYMDMRGGGMVSGRTPVLDPPSYEKPGPFDMLDTGSPLLPRMSQSLSSLSSDRGFSSALFNSDSLLPARFSSMSLGSGPVPISNGSGGGGGGGGGVPQLSSSLSSLSSSLVVGSPVGIQSPLAAHVHHHSLGQQLAQQQQQQQQNQAQNGGSHNGSAAPHGLGLSLLNLPATSGPTSASSSSSGAGTPATGSGATSPYTPASSP